MSGELQAKYEDGVSRPAMLSLCNSGYCPPVSCMPQTIAVPLLFLGNAGAAGQDS